MKENNVFEIMYLSERHEYIDTCASWAYGLWACQSGVSYELVLDKFRQGANNEALPITFIAIYDGKPAGMVSLWEFDAGRRDYSPWLASLYVHPFHRNKGISFKLIERLLEKARRLGFQELYLVTEDAKELYARFGWVELEELTTPYGGGYLMRKQLAET